MTYFTVELKWSVGVIVFDEFSILSIFFKDFDLFIFWISQLDPTVRVYLNAPRLPFIMIS